jgi:hypothetical protein
MRFGFFMNFIILILKKWVHHHLVFLISRGFCFGLSDGTIPNDTHLADHPNTFAISYGRYNCRLHGISHDFEWPLDSIKPEWNGPGDVSGCGLVLSPTNKLTIFFTLNGILMGSSRIVV